MRSLTVDHHEPRLLRKEEGTTLVIRSSSSSYVRALHWLWFGGWAIMEGALVLSLLSTLRWAPPNPTASVVGLAALLTLFSVAGGFIAWRLIWVLRGREILEINPARMTLCRKPGLAKPLEFDRALIRDLRVGSYADISVHPSWGRNFVGKRSAFVSFRYGEKIHRLGQGLSAANAQYVLDLIRLPD